ncbi:hypothetical protein [Gorillibacterium sp. sgz5001074]|uniref:hypothetical protein n=1 Tax=Gorillibacterium sp. sgz5001074 TaxID=3446695 RepID=UPI003F679559
MTGIRSRCRRGSTEPNPNKTSFRLPFTFMFTGMFLLIVFQFAVLAAGSDIASGATRTPAGWSVSHLLVLGWATMVAMGAVYQLLHVVLNQKVFSETLGYIHYGLFTGGLAGITYGFLKLNVTVLAVSATALLAGILVFVLNMAVTLYRARMWNPITLHVSSSLVYLAFTAVSGLLMGLDFRFGFLSAMHERLLAAHIWSGLVGWFALLIVGFSYKMLPMFYLAHNFPTRLQHVTLVLFNAGMLGIIGVTLAGGSGMAAGLALLPLVAAVAVYIVHAKQIIRAKHKAKPGDGIRFSVWALRGWGVLFAAGAALLLAVPGAWGDSRYHTVFAYLYFMGFVALTILGYLSKIAPFLWWTHRYGHLVGKMNVPSLADMISEKGVRYGLSAVTAGILAVAFGLAAGSSGILLAAQLFLSVAMLVYIGLILNVFRQ